MANSEPQQRPGAALQGAVVAPTDGANRLPAVQPPPAAQPPRPARRRQRRWLLAAGIVLVGGLGLGLFLQPWATGPTLVMVEIAEQAPVTRVLAVNGRIAARRSVDVRALVGGALAEVRVAEGDSVAMRAELARLDSAAPAGRVAAGGRRAGCGACGPRAGPGHFCSNRGAWRDCHTHRTRSRRPRRSIGCARGCARDGAGRSGAGAACNHHHPCADDRDGPGAECRAGPEHRSPRPS
jgi:hypothetical protein